MNHTQRLNTDSHLRRGLHRPQLETRLGVAPIHNSNLAPAPLVVLARTHVRNDHALLVAVVATRAAPNHSVTPVAYFDLIATIGSAHNRVYPYYYLFISSLYQIAWRSIYYQIGLDIDPF